MDVSLNIPALEKLVDYTASGIGSVAGSMLAPWKARREAQARQIAAKGEADSLLIQAEAQSKARKILISQDTTITGELDITNTANQRILFQEQKRQVNIESVVRQAAMQLGDKSVPDSEPDHDWTARFFNDVQDVSSEEMQSLWAKVLAGEVERTGNTSIRTLSILKNIDQATSHFFRNLCSACVFLIPDGKTLIDARVPSLGGNAGSNSLRAYGLNFGNLNVLNEHGLIISDYNSWFDYRLAIQPTHIPFSFQNQNWILIPTDQYDSSKEFKLSGVSLTKSGRELSRIIDLQPMDDFEKDLKNYFQKQGLQMIAVDSSKSQS